MSNSATVPSAISARSVSPLWLLVLIATITIATAWYYELYVGFIPCMLCLQERIPYYTGIPVALLALIAAALGADARIVRLLALIAGVIFLVGAGLGVYHAGVEWKLWLGPADCGGRIPSAGGKASDLMAQMQASRIVSCTDAPWRLVGLSFAGWNAVISFVLAVLGFKAFAGRSV